jgi:hypothetical protein
MIAHAYKEHSIFLTHLRINQRYFIFLSFTHFLIFLKLKFLQSFKIF